MKHTNVFSLFRCWDKVIDLFLWKKWMLEQSRVRIGQQVFHQCFENEFLRDILDYCHTTIFATRFLDSVEILLKSYMTPLASSMTLSCNCLLKCVGRNKWFNRDHLWNSDKMESCCLIHYCWVSFNDTLTARIRTMGLSAISCKLQVEIHYVCLFVSVTFELFEIFFEAVRKPRLARISVQSYCA